MAITQSPLSNVANNIVRLGTRSENALPKAQRSFQDFSRFLDIEIIKLKKQELPDKRKIKNLSNINVASNFGSIGNLLQNLLGGALDLGGFIRGMSPGKGEKVGKAPNASKPQPKPTVSGGKLRLGGIRALGIVNAVFAGLDFATGLAEGESVGKSASGAVGSFGGSIAGSLLGGAIGQTLIPIPGVGFVLGSMIGSAAGGFLGGYGADRTYEAVTGETKQKQEQQLKTQEEKQKSKNGKTEVKTQSFSEVLMKFSEAVIKFENFSMNIGSLMNIREDVYGYSEELSEDDAPKKPDEIDSGPINYGTGNAEFGETGNVSNAKGWVHGHFQGSSPQSVTKDTAMVVKALLAQGSPVYLNQVGGGGIDLLPSKKYTDDEIHKYVENARKAHTHSGTGKSIDVFVRKGTKVPVPLVDIKPSGPGYGGYGRGGNSGYIQGTTTWIGHLTPDSKSGLSQSVGQIRGKMSPEVNINNTSLDKPQQPKSQQPQINPITQNQTTTQTQSRRTPTAQPLLQNVMVTPSPTKPERKIETYPSYSQSQSYIIEKQTLISDLSPRQDRKPTLIPIGSGGGSSVIITPETGSVVLNSLMKNILLTNLSST